MKTPEDGLRGIKLEGTARILADAAPVMLWISDARNRCVFVNQHWLNFTGQAITEVFEAGWMSSIHPDDTEHCYQLVNLSSKVFEHFKMEYRLKRRDGIYRWILNMAAPLYAEEGDFLGYIGSCFDITELKEVENVKDEFVSTVSHELRTPLTIMREGISQVLDGLYGAVTENQKKFLSMAVDNMDRLERIIGDLLDISKIESDHAEFKRDMVDLVSLAKSVISAVQIRADNKGLELKECYTSQHMEVYANKDRITQVFLNLVSNALKFTDQGHIEMAVEDKEDYVECSVTDTGKGIRQEDLPRVFGKFQQFGRIPGPGDRGTGLGLAICKGIVELHGGRIWVETQENKGSRFAFAVPKHGPLDMFKEYVKDGLKVAEKQKSAFSVIVLSVKSSHAFRNEIGEDNARALTYELKDGIKQNIQRKIFAAVKDANTILAALPLADRKEALKITEIVRQIFSKSLQRKGVRTPLDMSCKVISFPKDVDTEEKLLSQALS